MPRSPSEPSWQRALVVLTVAVVSAIVVACFYWAQAILVPVALAIFLTFLLNPFVQVLQRRGLGRIASVVLVVAFTGAMLGVGGWLITRQVSSLADELPHYGENIKDKARSLRALLGGSDETPLGQLFREVSSVFSPPTEPTPGAPGQPAIVVQQEGPAWLAQLPAALSAIVEPFGEIALGVVLAVFMLLKREDLRDRFLRLTGRGRMTVTTKAVDEATQLISRYLLMQLIINGTYGFAWGLGLFLIGVPYAALWGFLAAVLRYVPYIGAPVAAVLPLGLSAVTAEGWTQPLLAVGLLAVFELVSNNVMEPWLYGQSIGVSEVALITAAAFWTFLWGPIGLVLSGPLTVCLVILGRYVPQLEFFDVLLGDAPVLTPEASFYQRLLARDTDEAGDLLEAHVKGRPPEQSYDELLLPALCSTRRDRRRGNLTPEDEESILLGVREIAEELEVQRPIAVNVEAQASDARARLLICPAGDAEDRVAVELLSRLLDPSKWEITVPPPGKLIGEVLAVAEEAQPAAICVGSLAPGGLGRARHLCKRLRTRFPTIKILAARWRPRGVSEEDVAQLQNDGADQVATTLLDTRARLNAWRPVLLEEVPETVTVGGK